MTRAVNFEVFQDNVFARFSEIEYRLIEEIVKTGEIRVVCLKSVVNNDYH